MLENLENGVELQQAAATAGLEHHYFSSFFRKTVGLSFTAWVTQLRVDRAQLLMRQEDMAITTVAYAVGFGSLRAFERAFRKHVGCSAREFRDQVRAAVQQ